MKKLKRILKRIWEKMRQIPRWAWITVAVIAVVALGLGLALGLTLPVKSVEVEGEVYLLCGESYVSGLTFKETTGAGTVSRSLVRPNMISGLDTSTAGRKTFTVKCNGRTATASILVLGEEDGVTLTMRNESFQSEFEPNDPFPTDGVFDLWYEGEIFRSAPIVRASVPDFSTQTSGNFESFLKYNDWLTIPYSYTVLEVIESITQNGVLYTEQGLLLSKDTVLGDVSFDVKYKDGKEEKGIRLNDPDVILPEIAIGEFSSEYVTTITITYKGFAFKECQIYAYPEGELFSVKSIRLDLEKLFYLIGDSFDYSSAYLEVEYSNFEGNGRLHVTPDMVSPGAFTETALVPIVAHYKGLESLAVNVHVMSVEEASTVTGLFTAWRGAKDGQNPALNADLDYEGATLTVTRGGGYQVETIPLIQEYYQSGYDKAQPGDQTLHISYGGASLDVKIRVYDPDSDEVTDILSVEDWDEWTYYEQSPDIVIPSTARLRVEIGYGKEVVLVPITREMILNYERTLAPQDLTFSYGGKEYVWKGFTVKNDISEVVEAFAAPSRIDIQAGEEICVTDDLCKIRYSTGRIDDTKTIRDILDMGGTIKDGDGKIMESYVMESAGIYPVRIYHPDLPDDTNDATWIHVHGTKATGIHIEVDPSTSKTLYAQGESTAGGKPDFTGMRLYLDYFEDASVEITEKLSSCIVEGFSTENKGKGTVTVYYIYARGENFWTTFEYTVE